MYYSTVYIFYLASTSPGDGFEVKDDPTKPSFKDQVLGYAKIARGTVSTTTSFVLNALVDINIVIIPGSSKSEHCICEARHIYY